MIDRSPGSQSSLVSSTSSHQYDIDYNEHYKLYPAWTLPSFNNNSYEMDDKEKKRVDSKVSVTHEATQGLFNMRALTFLILWYIFSFCTLFLNKYILATLKGDPTMLGAMQMIMTTIFGFIQMYVPCGLYTPVKREGKPPKFFRNMAAVGTMRFMTVVLGLVSLKYVAVSFTETVKSSAPIFTVVIAWVLLGERTGFRVMFSLVPIMAGLALCTAFELSFDMRGFVAAVATNLTECMQNVYSKMLISGEKYKYTPAELQFYTSTASIVVQIPACYVLLDFPYAQKSLNKTMIVALLANGISFHCQSITAYVLMGYISPVTHSPAEMQFYTGLCSVLVQIPCWFFLVDTEKIYNSLGVELAYCLVMAGVFYHTQTIVEYALLQYIQPVTHSVANTVKRALLIWISVLVFGNPVTLFSAMGMIIVTLGVFIYNRASNRDQAERESKKLALTARQNSSA